MKLNFDLTEEQKNEFTKAEQFGGSSAEIQKHPEWHQFFMNSFWNAEKEGRAADYYLIADYMTSHPSNIDVTAGKIGADFNYLYMLHNFIDKVKSADIHFIPETPLNEDGCVNTTLADFVLQDYRYRNVEHREPLYTGRMPIGENDNTDEIKCLMCEGNTEAANIYDRIVRAAKSEARLPQDLYGMSVWDSQRWNSFSAVLSMDDMNIRGQQIVDAYEYTNGSVEQMLNCLDARDDKMAAYVNQKTAERYLKDTDIFVSLLDEQNRVKYPMAKTNNASMSHSGHFDVDTDWYINPINAKQLANAGVSPMKLDYSKLDITEGIDEKTGFKIIEAHGFEKYFDRTVASAFGDEKRIAFFYNKHNGDIVEVSGALKDDIVYSGVTLKTWRDEANWHHGKHSSSGFEPSIGIGYAEFSYHHGLFSDYHTYNDVPVSEQTGRDKLGYQGIGDIPIPNYINLFCHDADLPDKLQDRDNLVWFNSNDQYRLEWMIDMMLAVHDPEIRDDICPDYKRLKDNPYYHIMKEHGGIGWSNDIESSAHLFQFAASWMHMPKDERENYYKALIDLAHDWDEPMKKNETAFGNSINTNETNSEIVQKLSSVYLEDPKVPEDIYALSIPKIEDTPFADVIPWLNPDVKEFEAAIAGISMENQISL